MHSFLDLKYAIRSLRRNAISLLAPIAVLSVVMALATALFAFLNAVLLRPFPYAAADRLVLAWGADSYDVRPGIRGSTLEEWQASSTKLEDLAAFQLTPVRVTLGDSGDSLVGTRVGRGVFQVLGVSPTLGRAFTADEETAPNAIILSHALWISRFAGDPGVIGQTVAVDDRPHTIVGVMPTGFFFPDTDRLFWIPLARTSASYAQVTGLARLRPNVASAEARSELQTVLQRHADPGQERNQGGIFPLREFLIRDYLGTTSILVFAALALLTAACANVGIVLLARRINGAREFATRVSLGAGRRQLLAFLFAEPFLLAVIAGTAGLLLGYACLWWVQHADILDVIRTRPVALDYRVIAAAGVMCLMTTTVSGLAPAWWCLRSEPASFLQDAYTNTRATASGARFWLLSVQIAATTVLLIAATALTSSFVVRSHSQWGFDPNRVTVIETTLPASARTRESRAAVIGGVLDRLSHLSGAESVGMTTGVPLRWHQWQIGRLLVDGQLKSDFTASVWSVSPGYLKTLRIPLVAGQTFETDVRGAGARHVVISAGLADRLWYGQNAIGKFITLVKPSAEAAARFKAARERGLAMSAYNLLRANTWEADGAPWEVIGVVGDVRSFGLEMDAPPVMYIDYRQDNDVGVRRIQFVARSRPRTQIQADEVRAALSGSGDVVSFDGLTSMAEATSASIGGRGTDALLFLVSVAVSVLSLLVVATGVYSVTLFGVEQRQRELGIRRALGANSSTIVRSVALDTIKALGVGLLLGVMGSMWLAGALKRFVYAVGPSDYSVVLTIVLVTVMLAAIGMLRPIRRSIKLDPVAALRRL